MLFQYRLLSKFGGDFIIYSVLKKACGNLLFKPSDAYKLTDPVAGIPKRQKPVLSSQ